MPVAVTEDPTPANNGLWLLLDKANVTDYASWTRVGNLPVGLQEVTDVNSITTNTITVNDAPAPDNVRYSFVAKSSDNAKAPAYILNQSTNGSNEKIWAMSVGDEEGGAYIVQTLDDDGNLGTEGIYLSRVGTLITQARFGNSNIDETFLYASGGFIKIGGTTPENTQGITYSAVTGIGDYVSHYFLGDINLGYGYADSESYKGFKLNFCNDNNQYRVSLAGDNITGSNQLIQLPNASGTVALVEDLGGYIPFSGGTMTGDLLLYTVTPSNALSAASKGYVDNYIATNVTWKNSVAVATTANITLSGTQTIDGVAVNVGDRVLVKNQTDQTKNGIYQVSAGAWTRTGDADTGDEIASATVLSEGGTVNGSTQWNCNNSAITLGTTNISFVQISGAGTYVNGTGILLSSNVFSLDLTYTDARYLALATGGTVAGSITATSFIKSTGTSSQFLKADGSIDSSTYLTTAAAAATYQPILSLTGLASTILFANNVGGVTGNANITVTEGTGTINSLGISTKTTAINSDANYILYSQLFTNIAWVGSGFSVTNNTSLAPDGTNTAALLNVTSGGMFFCQGVGASSSTTYTFSFYAKRGTIGNASLAVYQYGPNNFIVPTTSYFSSINSSTYSRVSVTFTTSSGVTGLQVRVLSDPYSTGTIYLWGAQLNIGATATPYVATTFAPLEGGSITLDQGNGIFSDALKSMGLIIGSYAISDAPANGAVISGNVGLHRTTPTAYLHLGAGTATANTAPIKLTSGTNLTTPEAGAWEYNGTSLFFSPSTTRLRTVLTDNSIPSNGQIPIGNGTNYTNAILTPGAGIAISNNAGSITISQTLPTTATNYTPTVTAITNITTITPRNCFYVVIGDIIFVTGFLEVVSSAAEVEIEASLTIPVISAFTLQSDLSGVCSLENQSILNARMYSDGATNNIAIFKAYAVDTTSTKVYFHFAYKKLV